MLASQWVPATDWERLMPLLLRFVQTSMLRPLNIEKCHDQPKPILIVYALTAVRETVCEHTTERQFVLHSVETLLASCQ
jgi:hypothetical protein